MDYLDPVVFLFIYSAKPLWSEGIVDHFFSLHSVFNKPLANTDCFFLAYIELLFITRWEKGLLEQLFVSLGGEVEFEDFSESWLLTFILLLA